MDCLNKNTLEYQTLKKMSGISDFELDSTIRAYLNRYNRYPEIDEIPNADSTPFLILELGIKKGKNVLSASLESIYSYTGTLDIHEAAAVINNKFKDLEVSFIPVVNTAIVNITKRPSEYQIGNKEIEVDNKKSQAKSKAVIRNGLAKFGDLYNINFIPITTDELKQPAWKDVVNDAKTTNAFVYNGEIYINVDLASVDAPVHELMHIFLGAVRYTNPELYFSLVQEVINMPNIKTLALTYKDRTQTDILEEIFVTEFSKFLVGKLSYFDLVSKEIISKLAYNINRNLDTFLMGNYSVKSFPTNLVVNSSLLELADDVESSIMNPNYTLMDYSQLHRRTSNTKSDLIKKGKLIEICL